MRIGLRCNFRKKRDVPERCLAAFPLRRVSFRPFRAVSSLSGSIILLRLSAWQTKPHLTTCRCLSFHSCPVSRQRGRLRGLTPLLSFHITLLSVFRRLGNLFRPSIRFERIMVGRGCLPFEPHEFNGFTPGLAHYSDFRILLSTIFRGDGPLAYHFLLIKLRR